MRVGELLQLAVGQVERPDVRNVGVARHFRRDHDVRIDRRGREHERRVAL